MSKIILSVDVVVNFLSQVIFVFLLLLGMVMYAGKREVEFMCVCDISKEKKEVIEELNKAQVSLT